ncbi:amino acid adenylation domain-containing protein [Enterobacter sp. AG5470]|nr:amino acid adenylation domain-containing protein [Enterobacter sp. AG5470]
MCISPTDIASARHLSPLNNSPLSPGECFPLSSAQQAIWLDQSLNPELTNYNIGCVVAIEGHLIPEIMSQAFEAIIKRHDAFQIHLVNSDTPAQCFDSATPALLKYYDFSTAGNISQKIAQCISENFHNPFDLDKALWRSALIRSGENSWYWQFCCHHIIADGMSLSLINAELAYNYSQLIRKAMPLDDEAPSYADFITDDAAYLNSKQCVKDLEFWLERYAAHPPSLFQPLISAKKMAPLQSEPVNWVLDGELFQRIEQAAESQGLSVLHFMYAVFACYFKRTQDIEDIVLGIPLHNRRNARQKLAVGMYASVIPVRIKLTAEDTFAEIMHKAATELRYCYKHQRLPIAEIQRKTKIHQNTGRAHLFDMTLSYEPYVVDVHMEGAVVTSIKPHHRAQYPLAVTINRYAFTSNDKQNQSVIVEFNYSDAYFTTEDIVAIQSRLAVLLEGALQDLNTPVSCLPVLPDHERQQVLQTPHPLAGSRVNHLLIHEMFEAQVRQKPFAVAAVFDEKLMTYDELNRRANRLAHHLIALGVRPNDRVAIHLERGLEMVVGILGILKAGGAYVPLDPIYPGERLMYMLEDAAPVALVTQYSLANTLGKQIPTVMVDAPHSSSENIEDENNPDPALLGLATHHLAYVIYTSGSTGRPKGVMVEHRNVSRLLTTTQAHFHFTHNDRWTLCHSFSFDFSVWELFGALCSGGRLIVVPTACARSPHTLYALLCREQVTILNQTPSAFRQLIAAQDTTPHTLRCIIFGGEALEMHSLLPWVARESNRNTRLINMYGITEITVHATYYAIPLSDITPQGASLIGTPLADLRIYILDERGQPVPVGVTGELYIGGDGVARGYLNRPELTAERFLADPFAGGEGQRMYRTGDLGRWRADGNIEYLGRNDFQVKLRGFRIEPGETEAALVACDGVRDAVVTVREDTPGEKRLVAYLVAEPGHTLSPGVLRRQLSQTLAEYMLPAAWVTVAAFPLTANGKLDRHALPVPDSASVVTQGYEAPEGETERELAAVWCDLLGLERVGRHDNFFELGGHSLMAVQLLNRLARAGMETSLAILFAHPILRQLAVAVKRPGKLTTSPLDDNPLLLRAEGAQPPLFFVHEPSGDPLVYSPLASLLQVDRPVYVLHALGMYALENPPTSLEALAAYHAEAIRRVQPHGPYYLCGWSLGGLLSYEIACQLHQRGEEIAFIGMIDSYHPALLQNSAFDALSAAEQRDAMILTFLSNYVPESDRAVLAQLQRPIDEKKAVDLCSFHRWLPDDMTCEALLLRLNTALYIRPLGLKYRPSSSDFTVNLYTAETQENEDRWRGWHGIVGERSSLHPVGGTHHSIMQQPRLAQLAAYLSAHLLPQTPYNPVVIMHEGVKTEPPLFCIPGAGASAFSFLDLAGLLPVSSPVYVLQARGLTEVTRMPHLTVEETARDYIYAMRQIQPCGPYFVVGHSFGGWIALEIALQLQAQGESVSDLIVIDSRAPGSKQSASHREAIMKLIDIYNLMLNRTLPVTWEELSPLAPKEQLGYLHQVLVDAGLYTNKTPLSALEGVFQVIKANLNTSYYPATRYRGVMHMINA